MTITAGVALLTHQALEGLAQPERGRADVLVGALVVPLALPRHDRREALTDKLRALVSV